MEGLAFWEMCPQVLFIGTADLYFIDFQLLADTNKILVQFREFIILIIPIRFPSNRRVSLLFSLFPFVSPKTVTREFIILIIPIRFPNNRRVSLLFSLFPFVSQETVTRELIILIIPIRFPKNSHVSLFFSFFWGLREQNPYEAEFILSFSCTFHI